MMYGFYNMMDWGGFGWIFMIIFWGLLILGGIELVIYVSRSVRDSHSKSDKTPLDILAER